MTYGQPILIPPNVSMHGRRLNGRAVFEQPIDNVDGFPDPARDKVTEKQDVEVTDMVVGNASVAAVANMSLCHKILFRQIILGSVRCHPLLVSPTARQDTSAEAIDDVTIGGVQSLSRHMTMVDIGNSLRAH